MELNWIPGKEMIFSDHLGRNVIVKQESNVPTCEGLDLKIHDVFLNVSNDKCNSMATETGKDTVMQALKHEIVKGWPNMRTECPINLQDFWNLESR